MKLQKLAGATSEIWQIFIQDSSSTTGAGLPGLVFNTGSLTAYYHRDTDGAATAITLVSMTIGAFTSSGFKEIDATNMPGWYQFCPPNAALAAGAKSCAFHLKGAANMAPLPIEVQLVAVNPDDATSFGLTDLDATISSRASAASVAALNNLSAAQVNAEVVDAINVDTYTEPGQGAPPVSASLVAKINYLYKAWRNRANQTTALYQLFADNATTVDQKAVCSDDNVTFEKGEVASGP
jgi:hypothetical protein